jgi:hypothetical protein
MVGRFSSFLNAGKGAKTTKKKKLQRRRTYMWMG